MRKLWISFAAAACMAVAYPASGQLSTTSSRQAEQPPHATGGTMHDHIERAEKVVNQLLDKRSAEAPPRKESNGSQSTQMIAVERTQLERLQTELNEINTASNDPAGQSKLDMHIANAKNIAATLANQPASSAQPSATNEIVVVDRTMLKQLHSQIEDIEHLAKNSSHHESK